MKIIATISNPEKLAVILDTESGCEKFIPTESSFFDGGVIGRAACRPFGITWDETNLYIVNNSQLLVYAADYTLKAQHHRLLHTNCHQAVARDGTVWIVSPWTNSILIVSSSRPGVVRNLDPLNGRMTRRESPDPNLNSDAYHFNGLLWAKERLFVTAHAFGTGSFILELDGSSFQIARRLDDVGSMIHGIGYHDGQLFWLSSGTEELCSSDGLRHPLSRSGFARGLAITEDTFVVGISERRSRNERLAGDSWVQLIDRHSLALRAEFFINDTGSLNDLRVCDVFDYAHWREPFIGRQTPNREP